MSTRFGSIDKGMNTIHQQKLPLNNTKIKATNKGGINSATSLLNERINVTANSSSMNRPPVIDRKVSQSKQIKTVPPPAMSNFNKSPLKKLTTASSLQNINSYSTQAAPTIKTGLLATELRAMRRQEYENSKKQKEILGDLMKRELMAQKMKQNEEKMKKLRQECIIRSNAIKNYKPVLVKPSCRPLTNPMSPRFTKTTSFMKKSSSLFNMNK